MSRRRSRPRRSRRSTTAAAVRRPEDTRGPGFALGARPICWRWSRSSSAFTPPSRWSPCWSGRAGWCSPPGSTCQPPEAAAETAGFLSDLVRQHQIEEFVLFAYSAGPGPARQLLTGLLEELPAGLVNEALYVDGSRWWSLTCDGACCPVEGTPYEVASHPLAAAAVFAGMTARADRGELAALGQRSTGRRGGAADRADRHRIGRARRAGRSAARRPDARVHPARGSRGACAPDGAGLRRARPARDQPAAA